MRSISALALAGALVASACSGGGADENDAALIEAGSNVVIDDSQLEDPEPVTTGTDTAEPTDDASGAEAEPAEPDETEPAEDEPIPIEEEEQPAGLVLVDSITIFNDCLDREGYEFIGVPDPENPDSPTNEPNYLEALGICATESDILQALDDFQNESENLTPTEIEQRNIIAEPFRQCLLGLGWDFPEYVPDANGLLVPDGTPGPPGGNLDIGDDVNECLQQAQAETQTELDALDAADEDGG